MILYVYGAVPPNSVMVTVDIFTELSAAQAKSVVVAEASKRTGSPKVTLAVSEHPLPEFTCMVYVPAGNPVNIFEFCGDTVIGAVIS